MTIEVLYLMRFLDVILGTLIAAPRRLLPVAKIPLQRDIRWLSHIQEHATHAPIPNMTLTTFLRQQGCKISHHKRVTHTNVTVLSE
jgi:hypothetical protein